MKVKLISYSRAPIGPEPEKNVQDLIAFCARVSNPDNQHNKKTNEKLLKYKNEGTKNFTISIIWKMNQKALNTSASLSKGLLSENTYFLLKYMFYCLELLGFHLLLNFLL